MGEKGRTKESEFFWKTAESFLKKKDVTEGTLMGFPCLRVSGEFFATCDHRTGDLIVKLPASRVAELIDSGDGEPFAPAGRVFKEWVLIKGRDTGRWTSLMNEAAAFVTS